MSIRSFAPSRALHILFTLFVASVLAAGVIAPPPAEAQGRNLGRVVVGGIFLGAAYCATHPGACGANGGTRGGAGPTDAIALDQTQAMWVQQGLQATGFYFGAIDGAIGAGTRDSIRQYQGAVGDPQTGALTGQQINDLVAVSPSFALQAADPVYMFNADLANDLDRDGVFELQTNLNALGYTAGVADGAFGGNTRNAIAAYKAAQGLPGAPVASRRLLAQMTGAPAPVPAGLHLVAMQDGADSGNPMAPAAAPEPTPIAPAEPAADITFDLVGVTLGLREDEVKAALTPDYGSTFPYETAPAPSFGGNDKLTTAGLAVQPSWPAPASEQMLTLYDATRPELGLIAAFRLIQMPEGIDQAVFEAQVLPGIIDKYGEEAMFGAGRLWIGGGGARAAARGDANTLLTCGDLRIASVAPAEDAAGALWSTGGGVTLDARSLETVSADCGQVLNVVYDGSVIRIGLWNSAALSNAVMAPVIKF
jgi:peptidoglycan hydrolase-like protein with peptidoglycan-binding domain